MSDSLSDIIDKKIARVSNSHFKTTISYGLSNSMRGFDKNASFMKIYETFINCIYIENRIDVNKDDKASISFRGNDLNKNGKLNRKH